MKKNPFLWKDAVFSLLTLVVTFVLNLLQQWFQTQALIPMIFVLGVFLISWLTQTEYNILAFLSEHTGKVLTYSAIIGSIWGRMDEGSIKKLQVNMANIRKKLGVGYRMLEE